MRSLPHIAGRVLGTPLVIGQARLEAILSVLGPRIGIDPPTVALPGEVARRRPSTVTSGGIAVIPVFGTLVKRAGPIEAASGLTAYADLETAFLDAMTDPAVRAVLLDVDSPGGEASGVFDLADLIFEARSLKPVWAVANEEAFSGAYAIASAAERVFVPRTGGVGSIGVIAVHVDRSASDAMEGFRYTTVFAGARKNDFNPHEALADDARAILQAEVGRVHGLFTNAVARNRSMTVDAVNATEAGLFFGDDAVAAGLADEVGTLRDALTALGGILSVPSPTATVTPGASTHKEHVMTDISIEETHASPDTGSESQPPPAPSVEASRNTNPGSPSAEVVDLDRVRSEARGEGFREAALIAEFCALAGMPERTPEMIGRGLTVDEVRAELLALRAEGDEIRSQIVPGAGTAERTNFEDNPVVRAAEARVAATMEA
ncbi:MAG TPA: S49 family peptidase [Thermohalobaculum sp.]|nr:S49 family peptidase [Thermohalobaculum sp.]